MSLTLPIKSRQQPCDVVDQLKYSSSLTTSTSVGSFPKSTLSFDRTHSRLRPRPEAARCSSLFELSIETDQSPNPNPPLADFPSPNLTPDPELLLTASARPVFESPRPKKGIWRHASPPPTLYLKSQATENSAWLQGSPGRTNNNKGTTTMKSDDPLRKGSFGGQDDTSEFFSPCLSECGSERVDGVQGCDVDDANADDEGDGGGDDGGGGGENGSESCAEAFNGEAHPTLHLFRDVFLYKVDRFEDFYEIGPVIGIGSEGLVRMCRPIDPGRFAEKEDMRQRSSLSVDSMGHSSSNVSLSRLNNASKIFHSFSTLSVSELESRMKLAYSVWWKRDTTQTAYAVKILPRDFFADSEDIHIMADFLCSLRQSHILKYIALYEDAEGFYLVMERALGPELHNFLSSQEHISERICRELARQILDAMHFVHSVGVIHRDMKPENFVCKDPVPEGVAPHVLLIDFGLACYEHDAHITPPNGTPMYMAPEMFRTKGWSYNSKADIWSAGVVICALLTGTTPFGRDGPGPLADSIGSNEDIETGLGFSYSTLEEEQFAALESKLARQAMASDALKFNEPPSGWVVDNDTQNVTGEFEAAEESPKQKAAWRRVHFYQHSNSPMNGAESKTSTEFDSSVKNLSRIARPRSVLSESCKLVGPVWDNVSEVAKDLLRKMLSLDPVSRPSARSALQHPWFQADLPPDSVRVTPAVDSARSNDSDISFPSPRTSVSMTHSDIRELLVPARQVTPRRRAGSVYLSRHRVSQDEVGSSGEIGSNLPNVPSRPRSKTDDFHRNRNLLGRFSSTYGSPPTLPMAFMGTRVPHLSPSLPCFVVTSRTVGRARSKTESWVSPRRIQDLRGTKPPSSRLSQSAGYIQSARLSIAEEDFPLHFDSSPCFSQTTPIERRTQPSSVFQTYLAEKLAQRQAFESRSVSHNSTASRSGSHRSARITPVTGDLSCFRHRISVDEFQADRVSVSAQTSAHVIGPSLTEVMREITELRRSRLSKHQGVSMFLVTPKVGPSWTKSESMSPNVRSLLTNSTM